MIDALTDSNRTAAATNAAQVANLYARHRRGAWFRSAASLTMWSTAAPGYYFHILTRDQFLGVTWSVAFLLLMNPALLAVARRLRELHTFEPFSRLVNGFEIAGYTSVIHFVGGVEAGYLVALYCALIAYVGVVAPPREPIIVASMCVAAYTSLVVLERLGWVEAHALFSDRSNPLSWSSTSVLVAVSATTMFVVAAVGFHTAGMLRGNRHKLREQNLQLESRVAARTIEVDTANQLLRQEVEERKQAEAAAQRSGEQFRNLFDSISDLLFSHDLDGRLLAVNRTAAERLGYTPEELVGSPITDLMLPEARPRFTDEYLRQVIDSGAAEGLLEIKAKDGSGVYLAFRSQLLQDDEGRSIVSGSGRDVTTRVLSSRQVKNLQSQLAHSQKMEAVGTLASGIAHDFNNILQAIGGYAQLALADQAPESPASRHLHELDVAVQRAAELVRRLMLFSRGLAPELAPLDLNQRVSSVVRMLERTRLQNLALDLGVSARPLMIHGDHIQVEQLLVNLCTNARDAMPEGGTLTVTTASVEIESEELANGLRLRPGHYARLTVADTGCGMSEETRRHAFEPFFTTKEVGKGTGLGLSTVYGVVQGHHGEIVCASRPGEGTVFEIYFPQLVGAPEIRRPDRPAAGDSTVAGTETILVVDDEPGILRVAQRGLARYGYSTITAGGGGEALELFRERREQVALAVVDLGMPGMSGKACLAGLLEIDPGAKILMASGNAAEDQVTELLAAGAARFIAKPYRIESLARTIREILDAHRSDRDAPRSDDAN